MNNMLRTFMRWLGLPALLLPLLAQATADSSAAPATVPLATTSAVTTSVVMCVYDPIGANGPLFQSFGYFKTEALAWGVEIELKAYMDERIAAEDFKAGKCDLVNVPGFRARAFNRFTGTIDSIGALPSYDHLKIVLQTLASAKAAPLMVSGDYEVISIIPAGAIFLFVNDRNINSPETMAGKTIAGLYRLARGEATGVMPACATSLGSSGALSSTAMVLPAMVSGELMVRSFTNMKMAPAGMMEITS